MFILQRRWPLKAASTALLIALTLHSTPANAVVATTRLSVVNAYYGETQGVTTLSQLIATGAISNLTHLTYAFAQGTSTNPCTGAPTAANINDVTSLHARNVNVIISIGGAGSGAAFSAAFQGETPATFAHNCMTALTSGPAAFPGTFNGIDIDWEFPANATDRTNFNLLLQAFHTELASYGSNNGLNKTWLTAAIGPSSEPSPYGWEWIDFTGANTMPTVAGANAFADFYNVEFYNYAYGTGSPDTQSNASIPDINGDIFGNAAAYAADGLIPVGGVPASKIVVGIPFYGVHYTNVANGTTLGNPGTMDNPNSGNISSVPPYYYTLNFIQSQPGAFQSCSAPSTDTTNYGSAWTWNPSTQNFWEYDDTVTITQKISYAIENKLGGVFAWNLQHDTVAASLLNSLTSAPMAAGYQDVTNMAPAYAAAGLAYNPFKHTGAETYTITNHYCNTLDGPFYLVLTGLPSGVTASNESGTFEGKPYWAVPNAASLNSGSSAPVTITLSYTGSQNFTGVAAYVLAGVLP